MIEVNYQMDDIDRQILAILIKDSRTKNTKIAQKVGLSEGSVRERIQKLVSSGIVTKYTIDTKYNAPAAFTLIKLDNTRSLSQINSELKSINEIGSLYSITGEFDLLLIFSIDDKILLFKTLEKIRQIPGIASIVTSSILATIDNNKDD